VGCVEGSSADVEHLLDPRIAAVLPAQGHVGNKCVANEARIGTHTDLLNPSHAIGRGSRSDVPRHYEAIDSQHIEIQVASAGHSKRNQLVPAVREYTLCLL